MEQKLINLINWADVEEIAYSEAAYPAKNLGRHIIDGEDLLQAYLPGARGVQVVFEDKEPLGMYFIDEESSWFAAILDDSYKGIYYYNVWYEGDEPVKIYDPYQFAPQIPAEELERFEQGIHYELYNILGAHPMTIEGVSGTQFAVWAPNAMRVSVVGNFNNWDGRKHQMNKNHGVFELFIPGVGVGEIYKFEVKARGGMTYLKTDPVGFSSEMRPDNASVIADIDHFTWTDEAWIANRKNTQDPDHSPISVYELYLGSFARSEDDFYLNYQELADRIIPYIKDMGYTHVELMPIMEHPLDASWGYQVIGYYAPTSRYGTPNDFAVFVDKLHAAGIGVILDWVPAHFPRDAYGLSNFDGTCLYEHFDVRQGAHPHWGTLIYNYGRPEVSNYLIANALYWVEKYHVDGLRVDAVASMLYLDYGRNDGEWVANMYGGRENLEAIEFFKHTNSILHKRNPYVLSIAEESTAWPKITGSLEDDGLGFDLKWNMGYMNDFIHYISNDPYFRSYNHDALTFSMMYAYSEKFMLAFSHDEAVHGKGTMVGKMPGDEASKFAALRATYAYMMTHPGKKLLFMGQDIGEYQEFSEQRAVNFDLLQYPTHLGVKTLMKDLNALYRENKALTELDNDPEGFKWMNCSSWQDCFVTYIRRGTDVNKALFIVANFSGVERKMTAGVPWAGKYKEILNTDAVKYGGSGFVNPRVKTAKKLAWDGQDYCIDLQVAAQSVAIFEFTPAPKKEAKPKTAKVEKEAPVKEEAPKKNIVKKTAVKKTAPNDAEAKKAAIKEKKEKESIGEAEEKKLATYTKKSVPKKKK